MSSDDSQSYYSDKLKILRKSDFRNSSRKELDKERQQKQLYQDMALELRCDLDELQTKYDDLINTSEHGSKIHLKQEIAKLERLLISLNTTNNELLQENRIQQENVSAQHSEVLRLHTTNHRLVGEINQLQNANANLRLANETINRNNATLTLICRRHEETITNLRNEQRAINPELQRLQSRINAGTATYEEMLELDDNVAIGARAAASGSVTTVNSATSTLIFPEKCPNSDDCSICMESMKDEYTIKCFNNHYVHIECIKIWMQSDKRSCPMCRVNML